MSGPKGIEYQIEQARRAERRALAEARTEWTRLVSAARRFDISCAVSGHTGLRVEVPATPSGDAAAWRHNCSVFRERLEHAQSEFDARRRAELHRMVAHDLDAEVSALVREEARRIAEAESTAGRNSPRANAVPMTAAAAATPGSLSYSGIRTKIDAELHRLLEPAPELTQLGTTILGADSRRARILLADLSDRVSAANKLVTGRRELEGQIDNLRARAEWVLGTADATTIDPSAYLDRAEAHLTAGSDPRPDLRTTSDLVAALERHAERSADREIVRSAVQESLAELGYSVINTEVATADTLHFRSSGVPRSGHLVQLGITDTEIDIRTVRTTEATTRREDMAADEALCGDLAKIVSGLEVRGLRAGRIRRTEAGVVTPPVIAIRDDTAAPVNAISGDRRRNNVARTERGGAR